ncbi:trichohyalin-like protein 1 [Monodelphis domestica]|uniref:trichohyalin-like protein 1 n=1 Tax=Monodelphis domestica TaxID=13616 RepID=UPI00005EB453|nr:trichohyalin-like protein 1 [Monodelphis domestica]
MPQLLQSVICVMEAFQKYAKEEGDCWTLNSGQLKRLLLGEIGEFLKPFDILTAGTSLHFLDRDGDGSISFDEFILLIFDLLNICYQDIHSFLNQEPKPKSNTEEKFSGDTEACEASEDYQKVAGPDQYEQRLTGTESPSLVNPIEKVPDTVSKEDPQDDLESPKLLGKEVEHNHPKSQYYGEEAKQSQERSQYVQATGADGIPPEEKKPPKEFVKRTCSQKDERIVSEEHEVPGEQVDKDPRDHPSEQEKEQNVEIQSVHMEETAQRTSESPEGTIIKDVGEHTDTQGLASQEDHERKLGTTDLPAEKAEEKLSETERLPEPRDDDGTSDIQEPLQIPSEKQEQGKEYETTKIPAKGNGSRVPETEVFIDEKKEKRKPETLDTVGKKDGEKTKQMETLTEQEAEGKEKQLEGLEEKGEIRKDSGIPDFKSVDDKNHYEHKGPAAPEEIKVSEISESEYQGDKTPETRDRVQVSGSQDDQSKGKNRRIIQILDQPIEQYDRHQVENQDDGTLSETYSNPEDGKSGSETRDLPAQKKSQGQVDAQEQPDQGDCKNYLGTQESLVPGDKSRTPEKEVLIDKDNENITEEQEKLAKEKKSDTAEESQSQPESQESMKQKATETSPKIEIKNPTDDIDEQLSIVPSAEKEDHRKDPEAHGPEAEEGKGEESESQEAPLEGQGPETQGLALDARPDTLNPIPREDKSAQKLAGEGSELQYAVNKEDGSSPGLSELIKKKARDTKLCSSSGDEIQSNPIYENIQKTPEQPDLLDTEEHLDQTDTSQTSSPELSVEREIQKSECSDFPALLDPLYDDTQELRNQTGDPESDEEYGNQQEILAYQSQEDIHGQPQQEDQQQLRDDSSRKY